MSKVTSKLDKFKKYITEPSDSYLDTPKIDFEKILTKGEGAPSQMSRAKVHGGWLVWGFNIGMSNGGGLCFVPDENHDWLLETTRQSTTKTDQ